MEEPELTPTRLARLESLFDAALSLPATARDAFLSSSASEDPGLAAEVRALLDAHGRSDDAFASPLLRDREIGDRFAGERVGAYEIGRRIGAGGMGTVYEAVRADEQYRQQVAVKFLRRSTEGGLAVRRFRAERQILANLQHPNIASLIDGGVTSDGVPYFVMEYIDGEPITRWADARSLSIDARLTLFLQVCDAVRAAHQKLVVHRDLKPGNILVASDGTVKVIDFGIAKLLRDQQAPEPPTATQIGHRAFTPDYAAPEQIRGTPVDTTADVYALGVVLCELLAGARPFQLQGKLLGEVERIVCEQPAPRPSTVMAADRHLTLGERSIERARRRIEGDLDAVVLMALRKEPARRYASVDALARDVTMHLEQQPVTARPDGLGYRLRKFVLRRPFETAATLVAVLSLIGGTAVALVQARRAEAQAAVAQAQTARATEVTTFLTTMLNSSNPESFGKDITMRAVLDSAAIRLEGQPLSPDLEAEVRGIMGGAYLALGETDVAAVQYARKANALKRTAPGGDYRTAVLLGQMALVQETKGNLVAADSLLTLGDAMFARFPHTNRREESVTIENRARVLYLLGKPRESIIQFQRSLDLARKYFASNDSAMAPTYINIAVLSGEVGDLMAADSFSMAGIVTAKRAHGANHPLVASALSVRAGVLELMNRMDESSTAYREALDVKRRILGATHPDYATSANNFADHLLRTEEWREAAYWARQVLALRGTTLDETSMSVSSSLALLGRALARMDSTTMGERLVRESKALRARNLPAGHWLIASADGAIGEVVALAGRYGEAETILLAAEAQVRAARGARSSQVADQRKRLVMLYERWGKTDEAQRWRERLEKKSA